MSTPPQDATDELTRLATSTYVSLTTTRRDGSPVSSPVWVSSDGGRLYVWTRADAGKLKRIQHTPAVTVTSCDARGRTSGATVRGRALILDEVGSRRVAALHRRKYGLLFRLFALAGQVFGRRTGGEVGIAIDLD